MPRAKLPGELVGDGESPTERCEECCERPRALKSEPRVYADAGRAITERGALSDGTECCLAVAGLWPKGDNSGESRLFDGVELDL